VRIGTIVPSISYNSLNSYLDPTSGSSFQLSLGVSSRVFGGDLNLVQPSLEYKYFRPAIGKVRGHPTVFGFRFLGAHISPFGQRFNSNSLAFVGGTPIFSRFFLGGEYDIRGYNIRSISPVIQVEQRLTTRDVTAVTDTIDPLRAPALPVLTEGDPPSTEPFVRDQLIKDFTFTNRFTNLSLIPVGGDTQLVFNAEYRIPLFGPASLALFGDAGSAFNLRRYEDQAIISNPLPRVIPPVLGVGVDEFLRLARGFSGELFLNPDGRFATPEEIESARLTQGTAFPGGYNSVLLRGTGTTTDTIFLSQSESGLKALDNYRASVGLEFRFQMPVVNVPFRLIWAYNPNARVTPSPTQIFREKRTEFRFSIGRTF
jgi:outer membrane protein insertion porin family